MSIVFLIFIKKNLSWQSILLCQLSLSNQYVIAVITPIKKSEMMYIIVTEAIEDYRKIFDEMPDESKRELQYRYLAISQLHGRACQQYLEVLCLLKSGFADGAFARWRSMYELCSLLYKQK